MIDNYASSVDKLFINSGECICSHTQISQPGLHIAVGTSFSSSILISPGSLYSGVSVIATTPPYCNTALKQDSIVAATTRWSLSLPPPSSNLTVNVTVASTLGRIPNRDLLHRKPSDDTATSPRRACHHLRCGLRLPNLRVSGNSKSTLKPITPHH